MERGIIDRYENDTAVIEIGGTTFDYPRSFLPEGANPGDAVIIEDGTIRLDPESTATRKREIQDLIDELFE